MKLISSLLGDVMKGYDHPYNHIDDNSNRSIVSNDNDEVDIVVVDINRINPTTIPRCRPDANTEKPTLAKWSSVWFWLSLLFLLLIIGKLTYFKAWNSTATTTFVVHNEEWMRKMGSNTKHDHDKSYQKPIPHNNVFVDNKLTQQLNIKVTTMKNELESNHQFEKSWDFKMNNNGNETISAITKHRSLQSSITTRLQLRFAVLKANKKSSPTSTNIIIMNDIDFPLLSSIDVSNRNILFTCGKSSPSTNRCIVDGLGLTRIFSGISTNIEFQNFHFRNGFDVVSGGAIQISLSSYITFTNCTFSNNSVLGNGGAVMISIDSTMILREYCYFTQNSAGLNGGAIYLQQASDIIITGTTGNYNDTIFDSNSAKVGGAIYLDNTLSLFTPMTMNISNAMFSNNSALAQGGAFSTSLVGPKTILLNQVTFDSNTAILDGGSFVASAADIKIVGSNLLRNNMIAQSLNVFSCQLCNTFIVHDTIIRDNIGVMSIGLTPHISIINTVFDQNLGRPFMLSITTCPDVTLKSVSFFNNEAVSITASAVVHVLSSTATLQDMIFTNNTAANTLRLALSSATLTNLSFLNNIEPIAFQPLKLLGFGGGNGGAQFGSVVSAVGNIDINNVKFSRAPNSNETYCDIFFFASSYPFSCLNLPDSSTLPPPPLLRRQLVTEPQQQSNPINNRKTFTNEQIESSASGMETMKRRRRVQASTKCVQNSQQLKQAASSTQSTKISVCTQRLRLGSTARRLLQEPNQTRLLQSEIANGIDLSNRNKIIYCSLRNRKPCILDGEGLTRIFYGSNATVSFSRISFANGYHPITGGALMLTGGSKISMTSCSFSNNSAPAGGTLSLHNAEFVVNGGGGDKISTSLTGSMGGGAPIQIFSSKASLRNMYFAANQLSQYGGSIHVFDTAVELFKLKFSNISRSGRRRRSSQSTCNLYMFFDRKNPSQQASCLNFE